MVSYFSDIVKDLVENTDVATKALFESEAGTAEVSQIIPLFGSFEWFPLVEGLVVRIHDRLEYSPNKNVWPLILW